MTPEQIAELNSVAGGGDQPGVEPARVDPVMQCKIQAAQAERRVAQEKLTALTADLSWGKKLIEKDPETVAEWQKLTETVASDDPTPTLEGLAEGTRSRQFDAAIDGFAEMHDLPPAVVDDLKAGGKVAQWERDAAQRWKDRAMKDSGFVKDFLSGNREAAQRMALADIILSAEIDPSKAARKAA